MKVWFKEYKLYICLLLLGIFLLVYYFFSPLPTQQSSKIENSTEEILENKNEVNMEKDQKQQEFKKIMVDIKGAIVNPGVYEAQEGERVIDLINRAGGLSQEADETKVNLAMFVKDEMVLYIPMQGEDISNTPISPGTNTEDGKVNINTADSGELETLSGIGPSKSAAIIEYRETNGPFKSIDELKSISGIGEKTFEKLKDKITVD